MPTLNQSEDAVQKCGAGEIYRPVPDHNRRTTIAADTADRISRRPCQELKASVFSGHRTPRVRAAGECAAWVQEKLSDELDPKGLRVRCVRQI